MPETQTKWTDERLDDLSHRVDEGFRRVDTRFDAVEARFNGVDARFNSLDARFDALHRTIVQVFGGMLVTMIVGFPGLIVTGA